VNPGVAPAPRGGRIAWQLSLTLWVGGVWVLHFVVLPALLQFGIAPLLVEEVGGFLRPLMTAFAGVCAALQLLVIWLALGASWWRDLRAQLLLLVLTAVALFFGVGLLPLERADYWQAFCYLVIAFAGLALVVQPRPDEAPPRSVTGS
jgi:hypothetical protein